MLPKLSPRRGKFLVNSVGVQPTPFQVEREGVTLAGEAIGEGPPGVLLHGLSATRRNVVQGSRHLVRRGYRLIAYDARGHGASSPAPAYDYARLLDDLEAVLEHLDIDRAAFVGSSMGAATSMAFALEYPEGVAALVQITPAYAGAARAASDGQAWERLASELERGGLEAFVDVALPTALPERWEGVTREAIRQRMERHEHPDAVAQALRQVPHSTPWDGLDRLAQLDIPVLIVGSRDEIDAMHPLAVAQEYEHRLPRGELVVEEEGKSPLAWQGARLSAAIGDFLERVGYVSP
jgi:pimeloyl-ACP methyl ester carboxylesterase